VLSKIIQDGVVFAGQCFNRLFTRGQMHCPTCDGVLKEETEGGGQAYLVCDSKGKGCANPIKSFSSANELYQWRDSTWEVVARICKE